VAQRDYVRKKSQPKKNKSQLMPKLMVFMTIILITLFSAILYFVSNNKPNKAIAQSISKTNPPAITLPEQPQERWAYLKALETPNASSGQFANSTANERQQILKSFANNSKITTESPSNTLLPERTNLTKSTSYTNSQMASKWILQCGAFKEKSNADTLRARLAMAGINSNISSEKLYRVTAGPYTSRDDANNALILLKNNITTNCIIANQ
jgi:cell division protein FtsN